MPTPHVDLLIPAGREAEQVSPTSQARTRPKSKRGCSRARVHLTASQVHALGRQCSGALPLLLPLSPQTWSSPKRFHVPCPSPGSGLQASSSGFKPTWPKSWDLDQPLVPDRTSQLSSWVLSLPSCRMGIMYVKSDVSALVFSVVRGSARARKGHEPRFPDKATYLGCRFLPWPGFRCVWEDNQLLVSLT